MTVFRMTEAAFRALAEEDGGYCLACRSEAYGIEPDAREYTCESCGAPSVYGAEELLLMGRVVFCEEARP